MNNTPDNNTNIPAGSNKRSSPLLKVLPIAVLAAVLVYFAAQVYNYFADPMTITLVYEAQAEDVISMEGWLVRTEDRIFGGGQEAGRRAGTQDLRTQLAFAAAASSLEPHVAQERATLQALSDKLYATLTAHPRIHATMGDYAQADRLPGMVSIYIDGMDSEELIVKLDAAGFEVSAGSACSSGSMNPSHVLSAMGIGREQALGALRISFDDRVNPSDLDEFAQTLISIVGAA